MQRALVLGGGVAGIAAAFELLDRGVDVELFESRKLLGGRAFSFEHHDGRVLDNGPHVMLGCYQSMRRLLRRLGTEDRFLQPKALSLVFRAPGGATSELQLSRLPTPMALPTAVLRMGGLTLRQRLRAVVGMTASLRGAKPGVSVADWLERQRLAGPVADYLFVPLCLAIMNSEPEETSARVFLATLKRAFSGLAAGAAMWVPIAPWSEILGSAAEQALAARGARILTGRRVVDLARRDGSVHQIGFADGSSRELDPGEVVVSALPWRAFGNILPGSPGVVDPSKFESRSIVNAYFDCPSDAAAAHLPAEGPVVALVGGRPFQFVYRTPGEPKHRFALIGGAPRELDGLSVDEIGRRARAQLARYYPSVALDDSVSIRITKEARATLLVGPDQPSRPSPGQWPGIDNLCVCGDWTETGLPSTLEGAAESAERAIGAFWS